MKRVIVGAALFLLTAAGSAHVAACDWEGLIPGHRTAIYKHGGSTVIVSSDEEFVTVVTYDTDEFASEWM